jgi:hypothetical protein
LLRFISAFVVSRLIVLGSPLESTGEIGSELTTGQFLPLVSSGRILKLGAHEWLLSANGEVRYTLNTSRSSGCFRRIIEFR